MNVDYYALLTKAVAGKDALARDQIYKDAFSLITRSHLTREAAASHAAALEDAIRRIEDDIAAEEGERRDGNQRSVVDGHELEAARHRRRRARSRHRRCRPCSMDMSQPKAPASSPAGVTASSQSAARARRRRHGRPEARRRWRLHRRRPAVRAAAASGVLPHHRRSGIDRGRPGKPLSLSDRCQQFRAPLRHRDCAGVPQGRQPLPRHQQARMAGLAAFGREHQGRRRACSRRPAVPAVRSAPARCCWTSPGCSFTAPIRRRPSAISSPPDASGS